MKSYFFSKEQGFSKLSFFNEIHQKKTSAIFELLVVNCGKIQGQCVISVFKTEIRKWSQI